MPKISVIVPVYNVENYIEKCIESILSQTYTDFELLLINDGSSDKSGSICDAYMSKDQRIRVFHKKNAGVSMARNWGIKHSLGDWICFVDSDDWVENSYLEKFIENKELDGYTMVSQGIMYDFVSRTNENFPFLFIQIKFAMKWSLLIYLQNIDFFTMDALMLNYIIKTYWKDILFILILLYQHMRIIYLF